MANLAALLNRMEESERGSTLRRCNASEAWVDGMRAAAPFASDKHVVQTAQQVWNRLTEADWHEALAAHPRIGDVSSLRAKYSETKGLASGEQSGVAQASEETLAQLAAQNQAYERRFGHLFIVCATGKSADEMLDVLNARINNTPEQELRNAADEQLKITILRLQKLAP